MTLTLTPTTETRLWELAARRGQAPEEVIDALIQREAAQEEVTPPKATVAPPLSPTAVLFTQWVEEDNDESLANLQKTDEEIDLTR